MGQWTLTGALAERIDRLGETHKQVVKFGLIGGLAVLTDLVAYWILLNLLPEMGAAGSGNEVLAKGLSFLCGLLVTYQFNKRWTWRRKDRNHKRLVKFLVLYGISLFLNVFLNAFFLLHLKGDAVLQGVPFKYLVAFVGATGICATFTFLGQKFWIFRTSGS